MNSGATIVDDRETVELLRDHPHLLAIADAVRATQGERTRSALPHKRLWLAVAAAVACAAVAALIAFLAVPGGSSQHRAAVGHPPHHIVTVAGDAPANPLPLSQAQSDALSSFGVPLILPDTSVLSPSDAGSTAFEQWCPSASPGAAAPLCQVQVEYPSRSLGITYSPTALTSGASQYPDPLDQYHAEIAQAADPSEYRIVYLGGTPALAQTGKTGNSIEFRLGKLSITMWAPDNNGVQTTFDTTTLQALAQSMVDQAGNGP